MKKLFTILLATGVISTVQAEIYKITKFTKAQERKIEAQLEESSGDSAVFSTNKGPIWIYFEAPALGVLNKAKAGECYKINQAPNDFNMEATAKKVKCPNAKK